MLLDFKNLTQSYTVTSKTFQLEEQWISHLILNLQYHIDKSKLKNNLHTLSEK